MQLSGTYTIKSHIPPQHYKSIPQIMAKALTSLHEVFTGKNVKVQLFSKSGSGTENISWSVLSQFGHAFSRLSGRWPFKRYDKE